MAKSLSIVVGLLRKHYLMKWHKLYREVKDLSLRIFKICLSRELLQSIPA